MSKVSYEAAEKHRRCGFANGAAELSQFFYFFLIFLKILLDFCLGNIYNKSCVSGCGSGGRALL